MPHERAATPSTAEEYAFAETAFLLVACAGAINEPAIEDGPRRELWRSLSGAKRLRHVIEIVNGRPLPGPARDVRRLIRPGDVLLRDGLHRTGSAQAFTADEVFEALQSLVLTLRVKKGTAPDDLEHGRLDEFKRALRILLDRVEPWVPRERGRPTDDVVIAARVALGLRVRRWQRVLRDRYGLTGGNGAVVPRVRLLRPGRIAGPQSPRDAALDIVIAETGLARDTLRRFVAACEGILEPSQRVRAIKR